MGDRRRGRETALQILFILDLEKHLKDFTEEELESVLMSHLDYLKVSDFTRDLAYLLVHGVYSKLDEVDTFIDSAAENWTLDRLSTIDRNLLRMAIYELCYLQDIPFKATINEAIEIAKRFGSDQSSKFVNGVLDRVHRTIEIKRKKQISNKEGSVFS